MTAWKEKRTGATPYTVNGVTFECWHAGIVRYVWRSQDGRLEFMRNYNKSTYTAVMDRQHVIGRLFRARASAAHALVKAAHLLTKQVKS